MTKKKYKLTEADKLSAQNLFLSVTSAGIQQWLEGWKNMPESHEQYRMRDQQVAIGEYALKIMHNDN